MALIGVEEATSAVYPRVMFAQELDPLSGSRGKDQAVSLPAGAKHMP